MTAAKSPAKRQRRNGKPALAVLTAPKDDLTVVPIPPAGLSPMLIEAWNTYWLSPLSQTVTLPTDMPALRRLFLYYEDIESSHAQYLATPIWSGSTGQDKISPFARHVAELEGAVRALEDRFGLSPKARLELGVTLGDAARSLAELYDDAPYAELPAPIRVASS